MGSRILPSIQFHDIYKDAHKIKTAWSSLIFYFSASVLDIYRSELFCFEGNLIEWKATSMCCAAIILSPNIYFLPV